MNEKMMAKLESSYEESGGGAAIRIEESGDPDNEVIRDGSVEI